MSEEKTRQRPHGCSFAKTNVFSVHMDGEHVQAATVDVIVARAPDQFLVSIRMTRDVRHVNGYAHFYFGSRKYCKRIEIRDASGTAMVSYTDCFLERYIPGVWMNGDSSSASSIVEDVTYTSSCALGSQDLVHAAA